MKAFVALPYLQGLDLTLLDLSRLSSAERISAGKDKSYNNQCIWSGALIASV